MWWTIFTSLINFAFLVFSGAGMCESGMLMWWMGHITVCRINLKVTRSTNLPNSASILYTIAWCSNILKWYCNNITILLTWWASKVTSKFWTISTQSGGTRDILFFLDLHFFDFVIIIIVFHDVRIPDALPIGICDCVDYFSLVCPGHIIIHHLDKCLHIMNQCWIDQVEGEVFFFSVLAPLEMLVTSFFSCALYSMASFWLRHFTSASLSVVSPLEVGATPAAVSDVVGCSDIVVLWNAMRNWQKPSSNSLFAEDCQLPAPYCLVIGPFNLMEAADWLENDPQNQVRVSSRWFFSLTYKVKFPNGLHLLGSWKLDSAMSFTLGITKILICNILDLGKEQILIYHKFYAN